MRRFGFNSLGIKIMGFYLAISMITLSFVVSIIFENQAELIGKNTVLESEKKLSQLVSSLKRFTIEMKEGSLFSVKDDKELLAVLSDTIATHYGEFIIFSESEQILYSSAEGIALPPSFREDALRAHTALAFSGREYHMRVNEAAKRIYFYIPLKEISLGESSENMLFVSASSAAIDEARKNMYKQAVYVIVVILVFHIIFPIVLYRAIIYPLNTLTRSAKKFAGGDFTARVNFDSRTDEIGSLARSFNTMAEAIHNNFDSLSREVKTARTISNVAETISTRDVMTGLVNINYLTERIDDEIIQSKVRGSAIALLLIDIDNFDSKNQIYGNQTADILILETVRKIRECCSDAEIIARSGGDEFAVLCPAPDYERVSKLAEKIHSGVETNGIITPDGTIFVTVSVGAVFIPPDRLYALLNYIDLSKQAKAALAKAKDNGKNRIEIVS